MRKLIAIAALAALVLPAAFAAPGKNQKAAPVPTTIKCAVMTMRTVNVKQATAKGLYADYKGRRYFFCCGSCPMAFKADPAKYAKNASIPAPKSAPKKAKA